MRKSYYRSLHSEWSPSIDYAPKKSLVSRKSIISCEEQLPIIIGRWLGKVPKWHYESTGWQRTGFAYIEHYLVNDLRWTGSVCCGEMVIKEKYIKAPLCLDDKCLCRLTKLFPLYYQIFSIVKTNKNTITTNNIPLRTFQNCVYCGNKYTVLRHSLGFFCQECQNYTKIIENELVEEIIQNRDFFIPNLPK
jgi:hypothetical protein